MERHGRSAERSTGTGKSVEPAISTLHVAIRRWAEEHGAKPARVKGSGTGGVDMLRLELPGESGGEPLEHLSWEDWFERFHEQNLALVHEEITTRGRLSALISSSSGAGKSRSATKSSTAKTGSHRTKPSKARKAA